MKKVASDRASVIEEALDSFEWLYRIGIWLAFGLMGAGYLFWAGPEKESLSFISYGILFLTTIPLKNKNFVLENLKGLVVL